MVLGGAVAVLLHLKESLHRFVGKIGEQDLRAIMQLVLLALVILPVLPDRDMGPYGVLNPSQIWWMVVLIVGLSLAGYVAYKLFGAGAGTVLAALVVMIASTVVFARVLVEVAIVALGQLRALGPPIGAMLGPLRPHRRPLRAGAGGRGGDLVAVAVTSPPGPLSHLPPAHPRERGNVAEAVRRGPAR